MSVRVEHLSSLLSAVDAPVWVKCQSGFKRVERVTRPGATNIELPDMRMEAKGKVILAEFDDQRAKLDLDTWKTEVKDTQGVLRTLVFSFDQPVEVASLETACNCSTTPINTS